MIQEAKKIIENMEKEAIFYWLDVMVRGGDITESEAGFLLVDLGIE